MEHTAKKMLDDICKEEMEKWQLWLPRSFLLCLHLNRIFLLKQLIGQVMYILLNIYNYCSNKHCKKQKKSNRRKYLLLRNRTVVSLKLSERHFIIHLG